MKGITLIEGLIIFAIIVILAVVIIPQLIRLIGGMFDNNWLLLAPKLCVEFLREW